MLTTDSPFVKDNIMESELRASLVYHPFKAQVPANTVSNLAEVISLSRYNAKSYEDVLSYVTQILLADQVVAATHTGDEVSAIAYGMVQRADESSAFVSDDSELESTQLIF
jgi:hypothetical protein